MQLEGRSLLIRADANARMGIGHLMRCLALAQGWQTRCGQATFITACESEGLRRRLSDEGFQVITLERLHPDPADWEATSDALASHPDACVALDGYHFDPAYQRQIRDAGHPLLVIDDTAHLDHYYADVVLNQNINAKQLRYSCAPYTRLLLGTRYVLLRREFSSWQGWKREITKAARKVLITLGGGDPDNQTLKVIRALQQTDMDGLEAVVVVGASNPYFHKLQSATRHSSLPIRFVRDATNMPELMAWADVAVSAGGSTCWEMAFMGLPNMVLVLAENQHGIAAGLDKASVVLNFGWYTEVSITQMANTLVGVLKDSDLRRQMSQRGRALVDGMGIERVVECLRMQSHSNLAGS